MRKDSTGSGLCLGRFCFDTALAGIESQSSRPECHFRKFCVTVLALALAPPRLPTCHSTTAICATGFVRDTLRDAGIEPIPMEGFAVWVAKLKPTLQ